MYGSRQQARDVSTVSQKEAMKRKKSGFRATKYVLKLTNS